MQVIFLGTGTSQGIPILGCNCDICRSNNIKDKRLRSSVVINHNDKNLLIDCGPDFRYQMLRENINSIDAILFTHSHIDHTGGLDDIRPLNFLTQKPMEIFAEQNVIDSLHKQFFYIFDNSDYPGVPKVNIHKICPNENFYINEIEIIPIRVMHGKMPILGYRINNFAYITDAKSVPDSELPKLQNLDALVVNALQIDFHQAHFSLEEATDFGRKIDAKQTYFTHIGHRISHEQTSKQLPENMFLAYDSLRLNL